MDAALYLERHSEPLDRFLDGALPAGTTPPQALHAAMRHLILPGGKRFRPGLVFAACEAVGGTAAQALPAAAAMELVHTYSLIHDDLPCMDDDATRRGRPTVHVAHGEAVAVLAGDALLTLAFELLARPTQGVAPAAQAGAVLELAGAAGARGMVGGQADDVAFVGDDAEQVESVHLRKTGALIRASVVLGARFGGADETRVEALRRFGDAIGVAFQIADDLLDRADQEPCSLARVLGEDEARARADELLAFGLAAIEDWGDRAEPLRVLARFAATRSL